MAWECSACGYANNEDIENICACGGVKGNVNNDNTITSVPQTRIYFWGLIRLCLGTLVASLTWVFLLNKGIIVVYPFAFAIAIALSGLLSLLTNKSFSQLSESWANLSGIIKFILIPIICVVLYFSILVVGIVLTTK